MTKIKKYKFSKLYDFSSGISSSPEQAGHGTPFLSFSTAFNNYFIPSELEDLMDSSEKEQKKYSIKRGDIFLTRTSEVIDELGMSCVATKDYPRATFSGFLKRLRPLQEDVTYAKFMAFYLRSNLFRRTMTNNAVLTLRASLNENIFSYLELLLPPHNTQVKIGDFLYLLHEKKEINNRINKKLELISKTIYKYWFEQFDFPDSNGNPYKSKGGGMTWSEKLKKDIPKNWKVKKISEICEVKRGDLITAKDANKNGGIKVVSAGLDFSYWHDQHNRPKNTITVSSSGANAGYVNFWREPIFACDCITVRASTDIQTIFIFEFLKMRQKHLFRQARGSAQPHVYPKDLEALEVAFPEEEYVFEKYEEIIKPINDKMRSNLIENQQLNSLCDWLLPMLMNGQVSIN